MATDIELALMAGRAYESTRREENWFPTPQGWALIDQDNKNSGFEAATFGNGTTIADSTEIVISFAGTYDRIDISTDVALAAGNYTQQLQEAAEYYLKVKAQIKATNPDAKITLTGHSLGGGLASLIAYFFDEEAVTFDQAPFRATAETYDAINPSSNPYTVLLTVLQNNNGIDQSLLQPLEEYVSAMQQGNPSELQGREKNISNIRVDGEFLSSAPIGLLDIIGTTTRVLTHGPYSDPSTDLHSIALLTDAKPGSDQANHLQ